MNIAKRSSDISSDETMGQEGGLRRSLLCHQCQVVEGVKGADGDWWWLTQLKDVAEAINGQGRAGDSW